MNDILTIRTRPKSKYGITEAKKAQIDAIEIEVGNAQHNVDLLQIIVDSLNAKSSETEAILAQAEKTLAATSANDNSLGDIIHNAEALLKTSEVALGEMTHAKSKTDEVSTKANEVVNKLIYSAQVVNKLSSLIKRRKELNPLISDDLITIVNKLGEDANNAVSLTITALKSSIFAQTSNEESEGIAQLEVYQAVNLLNALKGDKSNESIKKLLEKSHKQAKSNRDMAIIANDAAGAQLNNATSNLNDAMVKLKSLKASLNAAKTASVAS